MAATQDEMIELLRKRDISDTKVIEAMKKVDRACFVPMKRKETPMRTSPYPSGMIRSLVNLTLLPIWHRR